MGGGLGGIVSGIADMAVPQTHEKHTGGFSGGAGALGILFPFVVINRPSSAIPAGFTKAIGGASVQTGTVGSYSGFTSFSIVRLDGIQATEAEKREIERLLMAGVYL